MDARVKPAHDAKCVAPYPASPIHISNSPARGGLARFAPRMRDRPCCLSGPGWAGLPLSLGPQGLRGVLPRQECRGCGAPMRRDTLSVSRASLSRSAGASRRATAVFSGVRATLSARGPATAISQLLAPGL